MKRRHSGAIRDKESRVMEILMSLKREGRKEERKRRKEGTRGRGGGSLKLEKIKETKKLYGY